MTHKQDFYRNMFQTKCRSDDTKTFQIFGVPIGNTKITRKARFHPAALVIKYHQKFSNSCCLNNLASAFQSVGDDRDVTALLNCIEESLTLQIDKFRNIIHFSNAIMTNITNIKGEHRLIYNLKGMA